MTSGDAAESRPPHTRAPRALIVATNFPPDASVGTMRTLRLVRHLAADGWDVEILTSAPERFRAGTVVDPALLARIPAGVRVVRPRAWRPFERLTGFVRGRLGRHRPQVKPSSSPPPPAFTARASGWRSWVPSVARACLAMPDREVSWLFPAVAAGWRCARLHEPDVIYSSGPPFTAHLVGAALARLSGRPWVADFRDPWARAPWRDDRFAFEKSAWRVLERAVVLRADGVVFVTATNKRDFAECYGEAIASRFQVVANGCDVTDFDGLVRRPPSPDAPFVLLHAGSLYGARNPTPLLEALKRAMARGTIHREQFRLRFIGRIGIPDINLPAVVKALGLDDVVEFVGHIPRRAILQEMLDASALLVVQPITTVSVPAKLYEYMAAGRPILALAEPGGETAELVQGSGAGIAVAAHDEDAIERALVSLTAGADDTFVPIDPAAYDGAKRAQQIGHILAEVAGTRPNAPEGIAAPGPAR